MDKVLKVATPLLGVVFLVLLFVSVRFMISNRLLLSAEDCSSDKKSYQYAFFLPASDNAFFASLKAGAMEAAKEMDCAVIFHSLAPDSLSFDMASYTGVNGIAIFSYEKNDRMVTNLDKILKKGVPVVQIENEVISRPNTVLIGTNSYDSGKGIAKIALGSEKPVLNIALIYSDKNPALKADANLVEMGLKSILGNRLAQMYTQQTTFNPIDAEGVIYELLRRDPPIDIIALTDSNDTLVAIQAIIDLNLVGKVQIIGFGDEATIKQYIDKGVVLGSIVRNPTEIGYRAVVALKEISTNGNTSAYVNTAINIITSKSDASAREGKVE
ncbi:MAG TPA: substrate-binding domain-containing protein [Spirochaetia bacterium]|nr:substrate-binding domain-containing protein [Spirochaetia bacterium]